jgi:2-iminoacetate synthase ThiH
MTSKLVARALETSGLDTILRSREQGHPQAGEAVLELLSRADILALGAAADQSRRRECSADTFIYIPSAPTSIPAPITIDAREPLRGTALLRKIATLRLTGEIGARIVVDWAAVGLEIAQIALSFGATDLAGPIASRRGLPMVDSDDQKKLVKRREIAGYVERAGFKPVFVATDDASRASSFIAPTGSRPHVES